MTTLTIVPNTERLKVGNQQKLKSYLINFYDGIHSIRFTIQLHLEIANSVKRGNLGYIQFWGCMQSSIYVNSIVSGMFSIFDDNNKYIFKKFIRFLRSINIWSITDQDLALWIKMLEPYERFRNCIIAHVSLDKPLVPDVDYQIFLNILNQFEEKLVEIHKEYITHHSVINGIWSSPTVNEKNESLSDLRKILELSTI